MKLSKIIINTCLCIGSITLIGFPAKAATFQSFSFNSTDTEFKAEAINGPVTDFTTFTGEGKDEWRVTISATEDEGAGHDPDMPNTTDKLLVTIEAQHIIRVPGHGETENTEGEIYKVVFNTENLVSDGVYTSTFLSDQKLLTHPQIPHFDLFIASLAFTVDATEKEITGYGITVEGKHTTPEPTSTLSLLALGTLGAASTLKRKLKRSKSTEKETTKVG